jgi:uncharacterized protein (TIGR02444 family)
MTLPLDGNLWRFAVDFYARDRTAAACLALQEELGVDICLLLFGIWAGVVRGINLSEDDVERARGLVALWQNEIVRPLRHMRQRLKTGPSPAPIAISGALRRKIKTLELQSERIELAWLEYHTSTWWSDGIASAEIAESNLQIILASQTATLKPLAISLQFEVIKGAIQQYSLPRRD